MTKAILPGATLGVLGSGQLGRMFAMAARRLGYRVHVYSPEADTPTGQLADVEYSAPYDDDEQLVRFAQGVDVVTFEFENVPAHVTNLIERYTLVRPAGAVLDVCQHRLREKGTLSAGGLPVPPFCAVHSLAELQAATRTIGLPAVLKTAAWGYDGKGQMRLDSQTDLQAAWNQLNASEAILESFVDFECEVSVIAARNPQGDVVYYGPIRNAHHHHILDVSVCPSGLPDPVVGRAVELARAVMESFSFIGVLCVEMFITRNGEILINELAPRPHNSGHLTIDAHMTCQFEQQVRSICGLPLGDVRQLVPAAMANLLGDVWSNGEPAWTQLFHIPDMKLHLYGKREPRPGRKMGHITVLRDTVLEAEKAVREARNLLMR